MNIEQELNKNNIKSLINLYEAQNLVSEIKILCDFLGDSASHLVLNKYTKNLTNEDIVMFKNKLNKYNNLINDLIDNVS